MVDDRDGVTPSDAELWTRAQNTNPSPLGELFDRHANRIYGHVHAQVDSRGEAEALTTVVFLEAWRRRNEVIFTADESVLPWLFAVANHAVRNRARTLRRHRSLLAKLPPLPVDDATAGRSRDDSNVEKDGAHVLAAFRQLRPAEQDVLALCVWQGVSHEHAALALGVPTGTVRARLDSARQRLAELAELAERERSGRRRRSPTGRSSTQTSRR
ncbi:MAG TPA: RNA polymerase sigma factor [Jiangellaceae bacterium]|nr:RNA polymerase sigma factor [Jiangellaceae bacterium]